MLNRCRFKAKLNALLEAAESGPYMNKFLTLLVLACLAAVVGCESTENESAPIKQATLHIAMIPNDGINDGYHAIVQFEHEVQIAKGPNWDVFCQDLDRELELLLRKRKDLKPTHILLSTPESTQIAEVLLLKKQLSRCARAFKIELVHESRTCYSTKDFEQLASLR